MLRRMTRKEVKVRDQPNDPKFKHLIFRLYYTHTYIYNRADIFKIIPKILVIMIINEH